MGLRPMAEGHGLSPAAAFGLWAGGGIPPPTAAVGLWAGGGIPTRAAAAFARGYTPPWLLWDIAVDVLAEVQATLPQQPQTLAGLC